MNLTKLLDLAAAAGVPMEDLEGVGFNFRSTYTDAEATIGRGWHSGSLHVDDVTEPRILNLMTAAIEAALRAIGGGE